MNIETDILKGEIPIDIYIDYDQAENILMLIDSKEFITMVTRGGYYRVKYAIENNLEEVRLFNIVNLDYTVNILKKDYKNILNKMLVYFIEMEDYDECTNINKMLLKI